MRYFIDTTVQRVSNTADDLIEAGFQLVLEGEEIFFKDAIEESDLEPFNILYV